MAKYCLPFARTGRFMQLAEDAVDPQVVYSGKAYGE